MPFDSYIRSFDLILDKKEERLEISSIAHSHVVTYNIKKEIKLFLDSLELRGINSQLFLLAFSKNPIKPIGTKPEKSTDDEILILLDKPEYKDIKKSLKISLNTNYKKFDRVMADWDCILSMINFFNKKASIDYIISPSNQGKLIESIKKQKFDVDNWFRNLNRRGIMFSSQSLVYYIVSQAVSAAHFIQRGNSIIPLDPDVVLDSTKVFIKEVLNKIK